MICGLETVSIMEKGKWMHSNVKDSYEWIFYFEAVKKIIGYVSFV